MTSTSVFEHTWGAERRRLGGLEWAMCSAGPVDVTAEARTAVLPGATPLATDFLRLGIATVREPMPVASDVTAGDLATVDALLDDASFDTLFRTTVSVRA